MAEQQQAAASAAFPAPPPFYKHFTTENLARIEELKASDASAIEEIPPDAPAKAPSSLEILSLPPELRYLIPPSPPTGEYRSFDTIHDATPVPPPTDPSALPNPQRLRTVVHRILLEFLSLTHILATNPKRDIWAPKYDELRNVFVEAEGVISEYRPHQARETLIEMMEEQVRKAREEIRLCAEAGSKVREVLRGLGKADVEAKVDVEGKEKEVGVGKGTGKRKREEERESEDRKNWGSLEQEVGTA